MDYVKGMLKLGFMLFTDKIIAFTRKRAYILMVAQAHRENLDYDIKFGMSNCFMDRRHFTKDGLELKW
jgi:hypothetical protein